VVGAVARDLVADEIGAAAVRDLNEVPDALHASATYRRQLGAVMVARAWRSAIKEATSV
jgi:carbon-monoxide dehydrogenase medium subunit